MTKELFKQAALKWINVPYKWGGDDGLKGIDCSGLAQELLAMVGADPSGDQTAQALYNYFKNRSEEVKDTGALVFYGQSPAAITHVAVMLDQETIIEAGGGGSRTNTIEDAAAQNAVVRLRPWNRRKDVVAVLRPPEMRWS